MFELSRSPTSLDSSNNTVVAGRDRVKLFKGAELALLELSTQERFSDTQVAVASSTTKREWALECLRLFQVFRQVVLRHPCDEKSIACAYGVPR